MKVESENVVRQLFSSGEKGKMYFGIPDTEQAGKSWPYVAREPIPGYEPPGNLLFQIKRPDGEDREIPSKNVPEHDTHSLQTFPVPTMNDLSQRRLINAANKLRQQNPDLANIQRYIQARDLSGTRV